MDSLEVGIASAWHGEGFARVKRLPDLDKVLGRREPKTRRVDRAFTANETRRWRTVLSAQERQPN
jgi:hypothetical protein